MAEFVARCLDCQQVKEECKHPGGLLQLISIPKWKWEVISMDFITGLLRTSRQHDSIMVVVDRLTKVAHFIPVKSTHSTNEVVQVFIKDIMRLHGILRNIVSDRDAKFISRFWKELFAGLGIELAFSTTYHPHKDGHTERVNKILEDMLMHQYRRWEDYLPLVEFAYNNGYQESLKMSQIEALYGHNCNTPINWSDPLNRVLIGPNTLAEME